MKILFVLAYNFMEQGRRNSICAETSNSQIIAVVYEFLLIPNGLGKSCSPRMTRIFFKAETRPLPCLTNIALVEVA